MGKRLTTEEFVQKAKKIHGGAYDYSKVIYVDTKTKVCIICPKHGDFQQTPNNHLQGQGCPKCADIANGDVKRMDKAEFIQKANIVHGGKYDYSKVKYINALTKVHISCPIHGTFYQRPANHLFGQGCRRCGYETNKKLVFGFGVNDCDFPITNSQGQKEPLYDVWCNMIQRCYSVSYQKSKPTYIGCSVCDEWKYLSNFKKWFDANYIEGCHLDKDILVQDNKVYSPDTCCFVPPYINSLLTDHRAARGTYKLGVRKEKGRFVASVKDNTKSVRIGSFDTEDEAFNAYVKAKKEVIEKTARRALNEGLINVDVYKAIISRKIKEY